MVVTPSVGRESKMRVILAVAATAAILAGAALAGTSSSGPTTAQLNALSKRVATLELAVAAVRKSNNSLVDFIDHCVGGYLGVAEYGDASHGYVFNLDSSTFNTSALDLTHPGDTADYWLVAAPADCAKTKRLYSYRAR